MKILIKGTIEVVTGLHIGDGGGFSAIGAVDSTVIRNPLTKQPIIPGSSLKGKMRYLLARELSGGKFSSDHEGHNKDHPEVLRLFGNSKSSNEGDKKESIIRARLKFNDCFFSNLKYLESRGAYPTEIKFENTIDRRTVEAMPRQIERVIAGSKFDFELIYTIENIDNKDEIISDFKNIRKAMNLLEYDYLGGHGTRGSGRVCFGKEIKVEDVFDKYGGLAAELGKILKPKSR